MADKCGQRGTELFKAGDYAAAAATYTEGLSLAEVAGHGSSDRVDAAGRGVLLSNRAAAMLALGDAVAAEADCRAGLQLSPCSFKLQLRLAKALVQRGAVAAAAAAVAAAVALQLPEPPPPELEALYQQVASAVASAAEPSPGGGGDGSGNTSENATDPPLLLPQHWSRIARAETPAQLAAVLAHGAQVVVLTPGTYITPGAMQPSGLRVTLLGLGSVTLRSSSSHAVWVDRGEVALHNLRLAGDGARAAVCVSSMQPQLPPMLSRLAGLLPGSGATASVVMVDCSVEDYADGGLLLHGGAARLARCTFRRCANMAIEVRQGGCLTAHDVVIEACKQGVSAYGGARRVELVRCTIARTRLEGILAAGTYENAATAAMNAGLERRGPAHDPKSRAVTEEAEAWGKRQQTELELLAEGCSLLRCGSFGASLDSGVRAALRGCRFELCDPYGVYIQGASDALISACQFVYAGSSAKSQWAQRSNNGKALPMTGEGAGLQAGGQLGWVRALGCRLVGRWDEGAGLQGGG